MNQEEDATKNTHDGEGSCCNDHVSESVANDPPKQSGRFLGICIVIASVIIAGTLFRVLGPRDGVVAMSAKAVAEIEELVIPSRGVELPVTWGSIGKQLIEAGVIDQKKFNELYDQRGGLDKATEELLTGIENGKLVITRDNANVILNLLWAFGLANKNEILEKGPMMDKQYGGSGNFASTGGWTLASGNPMNHYSHHAMVPLTPDQQSLVDRLGKNIYRPCCGNSTYFPDCNHGMAMLGLLELMASQGVSEGDMYKAALAVNAYWFPDTYTTIAQYLKEKGTNWKKASPQEVVGVHYSSAQGYANITAQVVKPEQKQGGGGCGV